MFLQNYICKFTMKKRRVFDCVIFDNENELFGLRYRYLNDLVDYFIVVEGESTFQGIRKRPNFCAEYLHLPKVKYVVIPYGELSNLSSAWDREFYTRNYIRKVLSECSASEGDLVAISDVDEIPARSVFKMEISDVAHLDQIFCSYYYNYYNFTAPSWRSAFIANYSSVRDVDLNKVRFDDRARNNVIPSAGWHFSYLGNVANVIEKIGKFSETQLNIDKYKDPVRLENRIRCGFDLYDRNMVWRSIADSEYVKWDIYPLLNIENIVKMPEVESFLSLKSNIHFSKYRVFRLLKRVHAKFLMCAHLLTSA